MKTICVVTFAVLFVAVTLGDDNQLRLEKRSARYCGPNLVESMKVICNGVYKRSDDGEDDTMIIPLQSGLVYPFRTASRTLYMMNGGFRTKRGGIVEECCHKPCTTRELATYCGRI